MKTFKNFNGAFGVAALLLSAMAFTACSSDDIANVNPTFDGESVKTQFAINIPAGGQQKGTRLTEGIVQGQTTPVFRGMSNIRLLPFTAATIGNTFEYDAIVLPDISTTGTDALTRNARFYSDVAVPVGTQRFLFYAEATKSSGTDADNGALVVNNGLTTGLLAGKNTGNADFYFWLKPITEVASNTEVENYLSGILTAVVNSFPTSLDATEQANLKNLKSIKVGSSAAIQAIMKDLYGKTSLNDVKDKIEEYFDKNDTSFPYLTTASGYQTHANEYPQYLNLPEGAAQVKWSGTAFTYDHSDVSQTFSTYTYPASLYYWVNSALGAADATHGNEWTSGTESTTPEAWTAFVGNTNYPHSSVSQSTQSIVLKSPVQYAVSQLVYNVRFDAPQVEDNASHLIAVMNDEKANFKLKGILIGDQKKVGYDFAQIETETASKTIYDPETSHPDVPYSALTPTTKYYSLALQTAKRADKTDANRQVSVNIALEMINNSGSAFIGHNNEVIPAGGTFYLSGVLKTKTDDDNDYVFEQDHKTIANIVIKSLKDAHYTIPDLRKTELELGLYVDLEWQNGLSYDVIIGGE